MKKTCNDCIYREDSCSNHGEICNDFFEGSPEDLAEHETDISDFTGDEDFDDFYEHEDFEYFDGDDDFE